MNTPRMADESFKTNIDDMHSSLFQAWVFESGRVVVIDDGDERIQATVEEARALRDWLNEVLP